MNIFECIQHPGVFGLASLRVLTWASRLLTFDFRSCIIIKTALSSLSFVILMNFEQFWFVKLYKWRPKLRRAKSVDGRIDGQT